jgi:Leu/Phe-tRNA-protein transferase
MRRAIRAKDGADAAAGDGTCILFFYLMDPKHRLLIWCFAQGIFPARQVRSLLTLTEMRKRDRVMLDTSHTAAPLRRSGNFDSNSGKVFHFGNLIMQ